MSVRRTAFIGSPIIPLLLSLLASCETIQGKSIYGSIDVPGGTFGTGEVRVERRIGSAGVIQELARILPFAIQKNNLKVAEHPDYLVDVDVREREFYKGIRCRTSLLVQVSIRLAGSRADDCLLLSRTCIDLPSTADSRLLETILMDTLGAATRRIEK